MINYDDLTPATRSDWDHLVRLYAKSYFLWRNKTAFRRGRDLDKNFASWWFMKGPTDFKNTEDTFRFKAEIRAVIERMILTGEDADV